LKKRSEPEGTDDLRSAIMGLGDRSMRKSYFPALQHRLYDLQRFRALLDESSDGILLVRAGDGVIVDGNRAAWTLAGRTGGSLAGRPVGEFCPTLAARLRHGASLDSPVVCRGPDHRSVTLELVIREVKFEEEPFLVVVARDVTDRERAAAALRSAKEAAEAASRAKTEFLNVAAHELRTPLTTLVMVLRQVRTREDGRIDPRILGRVERQVRRLAALANDLLDDARLEQGTLTLHREVIDLGELIDEALRRRRLGPALETGWNLPWEAAPERAEPAGPGPGRDGRAPEEPSSVRRAMGRERAGAPSRPVEFVRPVGAVPISADPIRVAQVLDEFLDNAERFALEAGPVVVRLDATDAEARVEVADRGPGLAPEERGRVFDRLTRGRPESSRTQPGLGLGLHLARRLVELHGGRIGVESSPGSGSRFWFTLPREA
jgi:two-component system CheB/CheR fusion protein